MRGLPLICLFAKNCCYQIPKFELNYFELDLNFTCYLIIQMSVWKLLIVRSSLEEIYLLNLIINTWIEIWKESLLKTITWKLQQEPLWFHLVKTNSYKKIYSITINKKNSCCKEYKFCCCRISSWKPFQLLTISFERAENYSVWKSSCSNRYNFSLSSLWYNNESNAV